MRVIMLAVSSVSLALSGCGEQERQPSPIDGRWTQVREGDCSERGIVIVIDGIVFGSDGPAGNTPFGKVLAIHDRSGGVFDMEARFIESLPTGKAMADKPRVFRFNQPNPDRLSLTHVEDDDGELIAPPSGIGHALDLKRCPPQSA